MARVVVETHGVTQALLRNRERIVHLEDLSLELEHAAGEVRHATQQWFDSQGEGSWPELAEATIAQKQALGVDSPETPLVRWGLLRDSLISPTGPYSFTLRGHDWIGVGVDWAENGWQIAVVLSEGDATHPARHIWPPQESAESVRMRTSIGELLLRGI